MKKKKGGNGLQEMVKGIDKWWFGELTSRRGVKDLVEQRSPHLGPIRSPITQWWDQLQATLGLRTSTGQWLQMAVCDFEMQDFDCSRNQTWGGLLCGKSVRPHYCCLYDQRPWPSWWSSCLTEFQQGKWTGWWSTSGLKRTAVASAAGHQQTATSHWGPQIFQTMRLLSQLHPWMFDIPSAAQIFNILCMTLHVCMRQVVAHFEGYVTSVPTVASLQTLLHQCRPLPFSYSKKWKDVLLPFYLY